LLRIAREARFQPNQFTIDARSWTAQNVAGAIDSEAAVQAIEKPDSRTDELLAGTS